MKLPLDPTGMMFDSRAEAAIFFGGIFVYVFILCLLAYREEYENFAH